VELFGLGSDRRGVVHVIGPELGVTQPGKTIVCGDSHTATHGALGALAFGIGRRKSVTSSRLSASCKRRAKTLAINVDGRLPAGTTAKDLILAIIGKIGVSGGTGHVIDIAVPASRRSRWMSAWTVCNMSIEAACARGHGGA